MKLIVVAGHHRGGTSAAAGGLVRLGLWPGPKERLMPPSVDNPKGYYEYLPLVAEHDRLLLGLDRAWDDNRPLPSDWTSSLAARQAKRAIRRCLSDLARDAGEREIVVKDPRVVRLLPLYRAAAWEEGLTLRALVVDRPLQAVAASLVKRDGWDQNRAWEFVCQQDGYLREWLALGTSVAYPDFLQPPFLEFVGAARRLVDDKVVYDPRELAAYFDARLNHNG